MRFYCKNETKTKQGCDQKKNISKTSIKQTKGDGEFYFYLYLLNT
jgi:hypothetical protein